MRVLSSAGFVTAARKNSFGPGLDSVSGALSPSSSSSPSSLASDLAASCCGISCGIQVEGIRLGVPGFDCSAALSICVKSPEPC